MHTRSIPPPLRLILQGLKGQDVVATTGASQAALLGNPNAALQFRGIDLI